ncbi:helix-hairpin-helix domain-containing protein [Micromonospora soli]|uniref:helix-hairpin-helix domain-containing protein n=1 Tax=Micromonospora sp. NBRC 110009 TaxID=3061627 RepID=UPI002671DD92|nr:helix-hairpin-helix domain-containing protein [Micromonospora sp. NBRC 110009]WKT97180.1 helix-hairpin-helix domain-containing protein [Micromonospora sp. NBRC 110009]
MSFGQWLVVILVLLVGLVVGWVVMGRRSAGGPASPTVEGAPATDAAEADAVVDQERPTAVVDEVPPPAAVTEEPVPAEQDAPPAAATLAAEATPLPSAEPAGSTAPVAARAAEAEPADADVEPAVAEPAPVVVAEEPATTDTPEVAPVVVPAPRDAVADAVPAELDGAADQGAPDDFRRIQGIGPKMAAALQSAGIRTYQQLAELDEAALRETIKAAGLRATSSLATWPQQAKLLAGARAEADEVLP